MDPAIDDLELAIPEDRGGLMSFGRYQISISDLLPVFCPLYMQELSLGHLNRSLVMQSLSLQDVLTKSEI